MVHCFFVYFVKFDSKHILIPTLSLVHFEAWVSPARKHELVSAGLLGISPSQDYFKLNYQLELL